ncbi:DUF3389 domain-containing protein [Psychromonas ossibalaenae]|uniref:DUF3389 domain-containing protein n=1 Tax=Psychromonas ossibalaenae TaxID=444922 RepID=UPI000375415B|nr:DUF3389 domain-containing protein [Psychromonas ossibalaenae]
MLINFTQGKIIANNREIMIKLSGEARITLQAQVDEITLIGGANVITAVGSGISWSLCLDGSEQLQSVAQETGVAIEYR